jgi:hypothetical protein
MVRSIIVRSSRHRVLAVAATTLTSLLLLPNSAFANDAPVVTHGMVTPTSVTYLGGTITVTAEVADDSGLLNDVFAEVSGPYYFPVALSQGPGTNEWTGTVELPANFTPSAVTWRFDVRARDTDLAEGVGYAGQVMVDAEPAFDAPPLIYAPSVTPQALPSTGGPVALAVSATDLFGILEVYAVVTGPTGATTVVLDPVGADRYAGVFNAPANPGAFPVQYSVAMTALDRRFQPTIVNSGLITVAQAGPLKAAPNSLTFGTVTVGSRASKSIVLRNDGKKSSGTARGLIVAPAPPFFLVGGGQAGIPFALAPGQSMTYTVEFRPTTTGLPRSIIAIQRADNGQPGFAVAVFGRGAAPK